MFNPKSLSQTHKCSLRFGFIEKLCQKEEERLDDKTIFKNNFLGITPTLKASVNKGYLGEITNFEKMQNLISKIAMKEKY